jgi:hypothetical protein
VASGRGREPSGPSDWRSNGPEPRIEFELLFAAVLKRAKGLSVTGGPT